ncbi:MAG: 7-cyano-7-deazaguanine synthase, partial [Candidatus Muiribacteriaceae bacterium]
MEGINTFHGDGVCPSCRNIDAGPEYTEMEFYRDLKEYAGKSKSRYDCIVMCSGGKDSTAVLYQAVRKYNLNPLAFTFDHGFELDRALKNVRRACRVLDVEHKLVRCGDLSDAFSLI